MPTSHSSSTPRSADEPSRQGLLLRQLFRCQFPSSELARGYSLNVTIRVNDGKWRHGWWRQKDGLIQQADASTCHTHGGLEGTGRPNHWEARSAPGSLHPVPQGPTASSQGDHKSLNEVLMQGQDTGRLCRRPGTVEDGRDSVEPWGAVCVAWDRGQSWQGNGQQHTEDNTHVGNAM